MEIFRCLYYNLLAASMFLFMAVSAVDLYSEALLSLKAEIIDEHDSLSDWALPSGKIPAGKTSVCSWTGVTCDKNSTTVVALDLSAKSLGGAISGEQFHIFTGLVNLNISYNSFSGQLPLGIFNLTSLKNLDISRNNFSGHFPHGISNLHNLVVLDAFSNSFSGPLPADVSQLGNLKVLNFAGSYFKGPIPPDYGSFEKLEFLHLAGNFLGGNIPPELGKLKTVTHMEIGYNTYQGSIPWQLGNMSKLQYLDVAGANLSGSIPKELSNLTQLESLFLFRNQLSGAIPWEFSRIAPLASLDLSDNLITGTIPKSFSELKNLKLLSVMYNAMSGSVPEQIAELPSLETLLIWNNFFDGMLPQSLGRNSKLKWVDVSTNNFNGTIPPDICVNGELYKLMLFSNKFTGSLSPALSNCSSLVRLRLEDNSFSGEIPLKFTHLPDITYVDLSRNNFSGGIPTDLSQAINLQYFNISDNPVLGGIIPSKTWTLPILQNFSASSCGISGNIPSFQGCDSIAVIELNTNNLSGYVPVSISSCHSLERIALASNNLSGHIPDELADLPDLSFIDLSHNSFSGPIPTKFSHSSSLQLLNVSFNDISGSIPLDKAFQTMDRSAFTGNPKLCGAPLRSCSGSMAIFGSKRTGKLVWAILLSVGVVILTGLLIVAVLYLRRASKGQWKTISYGGFPQFKANDVLRSISSTEAMDSAPPQPGSVFKAVLPTGITVSVKRIKSEANVMKDMLGYITQIGNARQKNLTRLLGVCYNKDTAYLLYDYLPNGSLAERIGIIRDWPTKYRVVTGIARGLCFLHHDCFPPIPHGDLKSSNILFDENMEPHLAEFGIKYLLELNNDPLSATELKRETGTHINMFFRESYSKSNKMSFYAYLSRKLPVSMCSFLPEWRGLASCFYKIISSSSNMFNFLWSGEFTSNTKDELYTDIYRYGEILLEILSNGRLTNAVATTQNKPTEVVLMEVLRENEVGSSSSIQEEIKLVLEVALLCTSGQTDRPSMEDALKLLSGSQSQRK